MTTEKMLAYIQDMQKQTTALGEAGEIDTNQELQANLKLAEIQVLLALYNRLEGIEKSLFKLQTAFNFIPSGTIGGGIIR
jgi:hypothetical protein